MTPVLISGISFKKLFFNIFFSTFSLVHQGPKPDCKPAPEVAPKATVIQPQGKSRDTLVYPVRKVDHYPLPAR
jgi:hypothetical protein